MKDHSLFHFHFCFSTVNMVSPFENRRRIVYQNCLLVTSNSFIIPSMIFKQLSGLSRYVQNYYMESSFEIYLDIEPAFHHRLTQILNTQLPEWNDSLVQHIIHLFHNQLLWDRDLNYAMYTTCCYARHQNNQEYLKHLAYLFEERISLIPELDISKLYYNFGYAARKETLFFAPYVNGSFI